MNESMILSSPLILCLYGVALAMCAVGLFIKRSAVLLFVSALIAAGTSVYALLSGASYYETAAAVGVFLLLNLAGNGSKKENVPEGGKAKNEK